MSIQTLVAGSSTGEGRQDEHGRVAGSSGAAARSQARGVRDSLPQNMKVNGLARKYLLKKVSQRWAAAGIIHSKKTGISNACLAVAPQ